MRTYPKLVCVAFVVAIFAGCSTVSSMLPSSSSGNGSDENEAATESTEAAAPGDTFLASDDYNDGDEITGVFLTRADYARMTEDFALQDSEFDWGWAAPGLDIHQYSTVHITVENDSDALDPAIKDYVRKSFTLAMKRLGLKPVSSASAADLALGLAVVDYSAEYTYAFVTMIHPFIEIELRLENQRTGNDLLLIRNQEHSANPRTAAAEYASDLLKALR